MLPEAIITPFELVIEPLATFTLDKAFALGTIIDNDDPQFRINGAFSVPIAAGRANLDLGRKNQFFTHVGVLKCFGLHVSQFFSNGSMKLPFAGYNRQLYLANGTKNGN